MKILEKLHLSFSIAWNLQLNVRNKSAAAECYIRTEVCLEGCAKLDKLTHLLFLSSFYLFYIITFVNFLHGTYISIDL